MEKRRRYSEQTYAIVELLKTTDLTFNAIGERYGISKARVGQIYQEHGLGLKKVTIRKNWEKICKTILADLDNNSNVELLAKQYGLTIAQLNSKFNYYTGRSLYSIVIERRNDAVVETFLKGSTAKTIVNSDAKVLDNPHKLSDIDSIYGINRKRGIKRYPNIGNRSKGGIFETRKVLDLIIKFRNNGLTYANIADKLNELGHLTISGLPFTGPNVHVKYSRIIAKIQKS